MSATEDGESLEARYVASGRRFMIEGQGKSARRLFVQPPKARFAQVAYDSPPSRRVYELRGGAGDASFQAWPLARASRLVVRLRDGAVARLRNALPDRGAAIEQVLVGRKADGADDGPASARVRIVPLPSIGHHHAHRGIRRVLVEVPAGCPLRADDVHWAFSGLALDGPEMGQVPGAILTPAGDGSMLAHYGVTDGVGFRIWRTVTPAALPAPARQRRAVASEAAKAGAGEAADARSGTARVAELARAEAAVNQALRHADLRARVAAVRVQREPFEARGERAEAFAQEKRFTRERLWHVEIAFARPIRGPVIIGDGRFLGLGVMMPVQESLGIHAFEVEDGLVATARPDEVTQALRRAVMARVQAVLGKRTGLPPYFTGHAPDGSPARTELWPHLSFVFVPGAAAATPLSPGAARLLVIAPHVVDRRAPTGEESQHLRRLNEALAGLRELRAGSAGCLLLRASAIDADMDPLFAASRTWASITPYQVARHAKQGGAAEALSADLRAECRRRGLPEPRVTPLEPRGIPGVGLVGGACLTFEVAVAGPIVLGRSRHLGGGLFAGMASIR